MEELVAERDRLGPFADLFDFTSRLDTRVMNKRQIENLARAGATGKIRVRADSGFCS